MASSIFKLSVKADSLPAPGATFTAKDNNDGKITGVDSTMEWRADGSDSYTPCGGSEITGLKPGTYYVRRVASGSSLSSGDAAQKIEKYTAKVPTITKQPTSETVACGNSCKYIVKADGAKKYEWHVIDVVSKKDFVLDAKEDKKYYDGIGTDTLTVLSINKLGGKEE